MTILELDALTLEYDKQPVLSHIDLAVEKGELVSLLGHSGCGKTTLIKAIAGLHPLSGGRVLLQGQDASRLPPEKRGLSVLFQDMRLFPHLSVEDNVAFGLRMQGVAKEARRRQANDMLAAVELTGLGKRRIDQLSGGQAAAGSLGPGPGGKAEAPPPGRALFQPGYGIAPGHAGAGGPAA